MNRPVAATLALSLPLLVAGCSTAEKAPPPAEYLAVEKAAQAFKPQREMALLYLLSSSDLDTGLTANVRINQDDVLLGATLVRRFYVFCLLPGVYDVRYGLRQEFLELKAGDIVARDVRVYFNPLFFFHPVEVKPIEPAYAGPMIAERRIGINFAYKQTKYRCRSLD
jgi:hypothetical protein